VIDGVIQPPDEFINTVAMGVPHSNGATRSVLFSAALLHSILLAGFCMVLTRLARKRKTVTTASGLQRRQQTTQA
tara:strand:- start:884 stop:1108 length:225 start_codon:yes stop_codon:yes gene_type:complete